MESLKHYALSWLLTLANIVMLLGITWLFCGDMSGDTFALEFAIVLGVYSIWLHFFDNNNEK